MREELEGLVLDSLVLNLILPNNNLPPHHHSECSDPDLDLTLDSVSQHKMIVREDLHLTSGAIRNRNRMTVMHFSVDFCLHKFLFML